MSKEKKFCIFWIVFSIILIVLNIINGLRMTTDIAKLIQSTATALAGITFGIWFCEYNDIKRSERKEAEVIEDHEKYWDNICDIQKKQTEKGFKTYGQTLEDNTKLVMEERLTMLEEELIDGLMYIEHIKRGLKD